ncbi:hypothetical protein [Xenorhabdus anantnagensis]|uniref:Uncharacterized protein n=1 Tax=Xenorhabdus anantnagensis TaxID=3025875 RepID=A0ABT5LV35_9GAMM|nr:hypothetical protein [Xenorhabdus anantnagensis]MDC9598284.1 hypothetical protein [Xenorhabdus anantnagensis]
MAIRPQPDKADSSQVGQNEKSLFRQHTKILPPSRTAGSLP